MKINWKKCKPAIPYVIVLFIIFIIGWYFYYNDVEDIAKKGEGNYVLKNVWLDETIPLTDNEIVQDYRTTRDYITKIGLAFNKNGTVDNINLHVEFREKSNHEVIQTWDIPAKILRGSGEFDYLYLSDSLVGKNRNTEISVSAHGQDTGKLEIYCSINSEDYGILEIDGKDYGLDLALAISGPVQYFGKVFIAVVAGFMVLTSLVIFLYTRRKSVKLETVFLIVCLFLGAVYLVVFPPYSEPDSRAHVATAFYYADIIIGKEPVDEEENVLVRMEDLEGDGYSEFMGLDNYNIVKEQLFTKAENLETVSYVRGRLKVPPTAHLPQILGTALGLITGAGATLTLYCGKIFSFTFYITCCYFGIRFIPFGKIVLFYTALLPISLEMATSYSYDSTVIALSVLMTGYLFYLKCEKRKVTVKDIAVWAILTMWLAPCKIIYVFISFLIILVPIEKYEKKMYFYTAPVVTAAAGILSLLLSRMTTISDTVTGEMGNYFTISMFFEDISESLLMIGRTIDMYMDEYLKQLFGGTFSWLDITVPWTIVILYIVLLFAVSLSPQYEKKYIGGKDKLVMGAICLFIVGAVAASMLFTWTPKELDTIIGIQGRYFLPVLPLALFICKNRVITVQKSIDGQLVIAMIFMHFITILQLVTTAIYR